MFRLDEKTRKVILENIKEDLSGINIELIVGEIEIFQESQPDVIDSTVIRAIQDNKNIEFIRILDVEYDNDYETISIYYLDIKRDSLLNANNKYNIKEEDKYSLLFELQLETVSDFCDEDLTFLFDSSLSVKEINNL